MNEETKIIKEEFIKRTKIKPLKFRLQSGSMKEYISIFIEGNKEDYNKFWKKKFIGDIPIIFISDYTYFKKPQISLDVSKFEFKSIDWEKVKIVKNL